MWAATPFGSRPKKEKTLKWFPDDHDAPCIGRGNYALMLTRPEGFKLVLTNPNK
jgi:hypothetical protein